MTEQTLDIPIAGSELVIHGVWREVAGAPIVVFVHGFTGHRNEHQFYNGARALEGAGFSTYRFGLYGSEPTARRFIDTTVDDHVSDLDVVVQFFKRRYADRAVSVVGHSLGGLTVLCSKEKAFDAAVLWDPAHPSNVADEGAVWIDSLNCWRVPGGVDVLVGDTMFKSWADAPINQAVQEFAIPTKVIAAGAGILQQVCLNYSNALTAQHEYVLVPIADHGFTIGETAKVLYAETTSWLLKYGT